MQKEKYTLYYDRDCAMCRRFTTYIKRYDTDKRITCEAYQKAISLPSGLTKESLSEKLHLVSSSGNIFAGGEALQELINVFPSLEQVAWMMKGRTGKLIAKSAYAIGDTLRRVSRCRKCKPSHHHKFR